MCIPCWLSVKRTVLADIAAHGEGQAFHAALLPYLPEPCEVVKREVREGGTLMYLYLSHVSGVRAFWCPTYGAGGWVDEVKAPQVGEVRKALEAQRAAVNCMAL